MRYVRPIHEIGEFDEPVLIWVGPIILSIPFQEVEGVQDVADALAVQDEVAGDLVSANHNRRGQPNEEALAIDAVDFGSGLTDENTATIKLLLYGPSRVFEQPFGLLFVNRVEQLGQEAADAILFVGVLIRCAVRAFGVALGLLLQ